MKDGKFLKRKQLPLTSWIILMAAAVLLAFSGYIAAKYIFEQKQEPLYVAQNFYFESDYLSSSNSGTYPQYTLQAGNNTIAFKLKNYPDELRYSEVDITYTVTLTKDGVTVREQKNMTLTGKQQTETTVTFSGLESGVYVVTATATSPYCATLKGQFTVKGTSDDVTYQVFDEAQSVVLQLTISTTEYSGYVLITWPEGVLPDNTDPLMGSALGNSHKVKLEAYSEYTFQFFKTNRYVNYSDKMKVETLSEGGN